MNTAVKTKQLARRFAVAAIVGLMAATAQAATTNNLMLYLDFDSCVKTNSVPTGYSGAGAAGLFFRDMSGRGHPGFTNGTNDNNGYFGAAFRGTNSDAPHVCVVVGHHADVNVEQGESFTVSVWEKVAIRSMAGTWVPGRGRGKVWAKAAITNSAPNYGNNGIALQYQPDATIGYYYNTSANTVESPYKNVSHNNLDNNRWVNIVTVGKFNPGANTVTLTTYTNGANFSGLSNTVSAAMLDNQGYLTVGGCWINGGSPWQRHFAWNCGDGWLDDFAMLNTNLTAGAAIAIYTLGKHPVLHYAMSNVMQLLSAHDAGPGSDVTLPDTTYKKLIWSYRSGLSGSNGALTGVDGKYTLILDSATGTGLTSAPPPTGTLILIF